MYAYIEHARIYMFYLLSENFHWEQVASGRDAGLLFLSVIFRELRFLLNMGFTFEQPVQDKIWAKKRERQITNP